MEVLITSFSHKPLIVVTAICLVVGLVALSAVYSYYRLNHSEGQKSTTWTKRQKTWARIGMVVLWGVAFAISWVGFDMNLGNYKKTDEAIKLCGKSSRLYVRPSYDNYETNHSFGAESVIVVDAYPYAYLMNDGDLRYFINWEIGCATVHTYESGFIGKQIDVLGPKISIPRLSKISVVLSDGSHVVSKNWKPSKYYINGKKSRSDIRRQEHDVYVQYDENRFKQIMSQPIDLIKIDTDTLHIEVRTNCAGKYKLCKRMQVLYDEMHYMSQVGGEEYNPRWRPVDSFEFGLFIMLSNMFLWFWSLVLPYKMYYL